MEENTFRELQSSVNKLKKTRGELAKSLARDKERLKIVQTKLERLNMRHGESFNRLNEKERAIEEFNSVIEKSQMAYDKILGSTKMLIDTIDAKTSIDV